MWEAEPAFREHLYHDTIVPMVAQLMGTDTVRVWHDQMQLKPARIGGPTIWHQDHPYWPVIQPADLVSAWVALEDATVENGAMSMVRRSHLWGQYDGGTVGINADYSPAYDPAFLPEGETVEVVPCEVPAGGRRLPPLPDLARRSRQPFRPPAPGHCRPLHARLDPLRAVGPNAHGGASYPCRAGRAARRRPFSDGDGKRKDGGVGSL